MVDVSPAFHLELAAHAGMVPEGLALVDLPELSSVLVATYQLKSPTYEEGQQLPDIALTVVHLPTMSTRRVTFQGPSGALASGFSSGDQVLFAARRLGGGRVLLWYGRTSTYAARTPYYLRVLDASQAQPVLGPATEVVTLADGGGQTDNGGFDGGNINVAGRGYYLGSTPMGTHRVDQTRFVAVFPVMTASQYEVFARIGFATRGFTVEGTTVDVDSSPWRLQAEVEIGHDRRATIMTDEMGLLHWVDEGATTYALSPEWIWAHHGRAYVLRWDGTRIIGATQNALLGQSVAEDEAGWLLDTFGGQVRVSEGVMRQPGEIDRGWEGDVWRPPFQGIFHARIGQRPQMAARVPDGQMVTPLSYQDWAASGFQHPMWGEPSEYPVLLARVADDDTAWRLEVLVGSHRATISDERQNAIPGAGLDWVQALMAGGAGYLGEILLLRSGFIVATYWRTQVPGWSVSPDYPTPTGRVGLSVWRAPTVDNLEAGLHRSRGHFS